MYRLPTARADNVARKSEQKSTNETPGRRLARLRRERGLTQVELAERLVVSQSMISEYESGRLRLHGDLIIELARMLKVTADELLGLEPVRQPTGVESRRIMRRVRQIEGLSKRDQQALLRTIDAFLSKSA